MGAFKAKLSNNTGSHIYSLSGVGFGLALTQAFLEMHGGSAVIISDENHGTVVNFSLPQNLDKTPPSFSSLIPKYSGIFDDIKLELSQVLPSDVFSINLKA